MDLHTGTPLWATTDSLSPDFPPLEASITCNVAVVGAGITGALLAHALSTAGLNTVVLE